MFAAYYFALFIFTSPDCSKLLEKANICRLRSQYSVVMGAKITFKDLVDLTLKYMAVL